MHEDVHQCMCIYAMQYTSMQCHVCMMTYRYDIQYSVCIHMCLGMHMYAYV